MLTLQGSERHERFADLTFAVLAQLACKGLSTRAVINILSLARDRVAGQPAPIHVDTLTTQGADEVLAHLTASGLPSEDFPAFFSTALKHLHRLLGNVPFHESWLLFLTCGQSEAVMSPETALQKLLEPQRQPIIRRLDLYGRVMLDGHRYRVLASEAFKPGEEVAVFRQPDTQDEVCVLNLSTNRVARASLVSSLRHGRVEAVHRVLDDQLVDAHMHDEDMA